MAHRAIVGIVVLAALMASLSADRAGANQGPAPREPDAALAAESQRLTDAAVAAGVRGDLSERRALLTRAQGIAPNYGPPRWEAGMVERAGGWAFATGARTERTSSGAVAAYERLRGFASDSPTDHLAIARWCRRHDLDDEARYHWLRVLAIAPSHSESLDAIGSVWSKGELVPADESRERLALSRGFTKRQADWQRKLQGWERRLRRGDAILGEVVSEARTIRDEAAIRPFERFAVRAPRDKPIAANRRREVSLAFVEGLTSWPGYAATESLARHAVWAPDPAVSSAAADALPKRPKHEAVPPLLVTLESPIETEFSIRVSPEGIVTYAHTVRREGPDAVAEENTSLVAAPRFNVRQLGDEPSAEDVVRQQANATRAATDARQSAQRLERQVAMSNANLVQRNARVTDLLAQVTGEDLGAEPRAWWAYWQDYNGYEVPSSKPTIRRYNPMTSTYPPTCECFAAGTPVWTKRGPAAIETLRPGDVVLSKDTRSGELLYRPVLATTVRPPSKLLRIVGEGVELRTTKGHPFWVVSKGWRMAKELAAGDVLWCVEGPSVVRSVEESIEGRAYNLVVEGTATYFVGRRGVLAHDNTPRRPEREFVATQTAPTTGNGGETGG
ncbi:MAG: polymorphic toxin-type HINT domain-containing protein [Lacipirellulaceae bacterium]